MKAVICEEHVRRSRWWSTTSPIPNPRPNEVVIDVEAASVNFPDVLIIQGKQLQPALPFSPGSEVAGTISSVGSDVSHLRPGDRGGGVRVRRLRRAGRGRRQHPIPLPDGVGTEDAAASLSPTGPPTTP